MDSEERARSFYNQFGDGLRYMHSLDFCHRDVKCENVLLNQTRTVSKLADFGFARCCHDLVTGAPVLSETGCGTRAYLAPEVLTGRYNPIKSDVWSVGVLLFMLLNNALPFPDDPAGMGAKRQHRHQMERKYRFTNKQLTSEARDVVAFHLNPDPAQRPSMEQVFRHVWFQATGTMRDSAHVDTATTNKPQANNN